MKNRNFLISILLTVCCVSGFSKSILSNKTLKAIIATPNTEFFGSAVFRTTSSTPWICVFNKEYAVEVIPYSPVASGDYWEPSTEYRLYKINADGNDTLLEKTVISDHGGPSGLRIEQDYISGVHIFGAKGRELFNERFTPFPPLMSSDSIIVYGTGKKVDIQVFNKFETYPSRESISLDDAENTLFDQSDYHIGNWSYLDRVTPDDRHTVIGGRYEFAIIKDSISEGDYIIVYLGGATIDSSFWQPGDIKGRLIHTSFPDHYNLEWYDSRRREVWPGECSATFDGLNMLTLDFPLLKSQIRFSRRL